MPCHKDEGAAQGGEGDCLAARHTPNENHASVVLPYGACGVILITKYTNRNVADTASSIATVRHKELHVPRFWVSSVCFALVICHRIA